MTDPLVPALAALERDGLCVIPDALSGNEIEAARRALHDMNESPGPHEKPHRHRHLTNRAPVFRRLVQHPLALRLAESMLGEDCVLCSMTERTLLPGAKVQQPHRDTDIWGPCLPWLPVASGINVIWPLDPFTADSGATLWAPGSHRRNDFDGLCDRAVECPVGSLVAFDTRLVHAGGANVSGAPRRAVFSFYVRSWLRTPTDLARSTPQRLLDSASPTLVRLLGFHRQSGVQDPQDGSWSIVPAPGATWFYEPPGAATQ